MSDSGSTLNIPQLLVIIVVSFLIFRWYNSSPPAPAHQRPTGARNAAPRVNPAAVEQVSQMFPQLNRRDIMWDLSRNGNNIAATTERILSGTGLEVVCGRSPLPLPTELTQPSPTATAILPASHARPARR